MSLAPLRCRECDVESRFYRVAPFGARDQPVYAVAWCCPSCGGVAIDLCPLGPVLPTERSCLECGAERPLGEPTAGACPACGLSGSAASDSLGLDHPPRDAVGEARSLIARGLCRRALALLNHRLVNDPTDADAWTEKAAFLHSVEAYATSLPVLERALAAGGAPHLLLSWGVALQETGRNEDAIAKYEQYLRIEPAGTWAAAALANQANATAALGRHREADVLYRRAIELEPLRATHRYNHARSLSASKRLPEALEALDAALRCSPAASLAATIHGERSWVLAELSRPEEALESAERALALDPRLVRACYLRGRALASLGRLSEARDAMLDVLRANPEDADALRATKLIDEALAAQGPRRWWHRFTR